MVVKAHHTVKTRDGYREELGFALVSALSLEERVMRNMLLA